MLTEEIISEAMYNATRLAATRLPPDVRRALEAARVEESDPLARMHMDVSLENARLAEAGSGLVCADTGFPLFFVRAGAHTKIRGGFGVLWTAAATATRRATADNFLRPTMVDPITRANPGDNVGPGMPKVELRFEGDDDALEIIAAPKGGGSEIFGTFYQMLYPSDGRDGLIKFILDAVREGCYAGKICPPAIIGVGIGGTADLCMRLAKEAAVLRQLGSANPNPQLAELETELLQATRAMGLGPMGSQGVNAVMAMHLASAVTHTAALPVAVNAQCMVGRRWKAVLDSAGKIEYSG